MSIDREKVARMAMILVTAGPADLLQPGMVGEFDTFNKDEWLFLIGLLSGNLKAFVDNSEDPEQRRAEFAKRVMASRNNGLSISGGGANRGVL